MKKRKFISLFIISLFILLLSSCVNQDKAKKESKDRLIEFLNLYDNTEVISTMDKKDLKEVINKNFKPYFTKDYSKEVMKEVDAINNDPNSFNFTNPKVFFMEDNSLDNTVKFNGYELTEKGEITFNKDQTVSIDLGAEGATKNIFVQVIMKKEDKNWKIYDVIKK